MFENIDRFHIEDIKNELHPSVYFTHENYELLILRLPNIFKNNIRYKSLAFIIKENEYLFFDKDNKSLNNLNEMLGLYKFINNYVDNILNIMKLFSTKVETLEDTLYEGNKIKNFNKQWYNYKTDLIRINRTLNKALETINLFIKTHRKDDNYLERHFEDISEHIQRSIRNAEFLLEKLDSIYNFHQNQTNEQMNRIVFILTLLSGIFLPLNLIVGFFGMNTTSLPFTQEAGGTFNVIFLLIISLILATLLTLFMKKK